MKTVIHHLRGMYREGVTESPRPIPRGFLIRFLTYLTVAFSCLGAGGILATAIWQPHRRDAYGLFAGYWIVGMLCGALAVIALWLFARAEENRQDRGEEESYPVVPSEMAESARHYAVMRALETGQSVTLEKRCGVWYENGNPIDLPNGGRDE